MRSLLVLLPIFVLAACVADADPTDDAADAAAESAPAQPAGGKADDPLGVVGAGYEMTSPTTYASGDVTNLQLFDDGWYVRGRCYHASCSVWATETQHYDVFTSSGHHYLRFYTFTKDGDGNETQRVADVYEIAKTSTTIKLRKTYTSRWLTLKKRTDRTLCGASGGTWTSGACDCGGRDAATGDWNVFAPGLGGCYLAPTGTEDSCDATGGDYTDDDATKIGTYCVCPRGTMVTDTGCVAI